MEHPALIDADDVELLDAATTARNHCASCSATGPDWGRPSAADREAIIALMTATAPTGDSAPESATAAG